MVSYLGYAAGGLAEGLKQGFDLGNQWDQKRQDKQSADTVGGALKDWAQQQLGQGSQPPQNVPVPGATPMTGLQQAPAMPTAFQAAGAPNAAQGQGQSAGLPQAPMPGQPSVPSSQPGTQQAPADPGLRYGGNPGDPSSGPINRPQVQQIAQQNPGLGVNPGVEAAKPINWGGGGPFSPDSLQKLLGGESGGKTLDQLRSMPGTHSAGGFFQFQPGTAKEVAANHPELRGKDPYGSKEDAAAYAQAYAQDNAKAMQQAGVPVTQGTLMLAHQQGAGGAIKLLQYPDARAADLVGPDHVVQNGGNINMTAREFTQHVIGYYDKQGGGGQGGQHPEDFQGHSLPMTGAPGPMSMQQLVGLIMARNPNISNAALARAVERMSPLLNMESRAAYNQQLMDFKYQQQEDKIRMLEMQIAGRQGVADTQAGARLGAAEAAAGAKVKAAEITAQNRKETAQMAQDGRMDLERLKQGGREEMAQIRLAGQKDLQEMRAASAEKLQGERLAVRQKEFDEKIRQFDERQSYLEERLQEEMAAKQNATDEKAREADQRVAYLRDALQQNGELRQQALAIQAQNADTNRSRLDMQERQGERRLDQGDKRLEQGNKRIEQAGQRLDETARHNQRTERQRDVALDQAAQRAAEKSEEFRSREARLSDNFAKRQDLAERKLATARNDKERAEAFKSYESALKDYGQKVRTLIDADFKMTGPDKQAMKAKLKLELDAAQQELDQKKQALRQSGGDQPAEDKAQPLTDDIRKQAQDAINQGAPKDKVIERLRQQGYDVTGF